MNTRNGDLFPVLTKLKKGVSKMKQDNTYNGWSNWVTWNFKLWIDNDYQTYLHFESMVEEHNGKLLRIAQDLKEFAQYQERQYDRLEKTGTPLTSGFIYDLKAFDGSIYDIDYMEIAKAIKEDCDLVV